MTRAPITSPAQKGVTREPPSRPESPTGAAADPPRRDGLVWRAALSLHRAAVMAGVAEEGCQSGQKGQRRAPLLTARWAHPGGHRQTPMAPTPAGRSPTPAGLHDHYPLSGKANVQLGRVAMMVVALCHVELRADCAQGDDRGEKREVARLIGDVGVMACVDCRVVTALQDPRHRLLVLEGTGHIAERSDERCAEGVSEPVAKSSTT